VSDTVRRLGSAEAVVSEAAATRFITDALAAETLAGKSVLLVIPDGTRTAPVPLVVAAVRSVVERLTILVALGTHQPMDPPALEKLVGAPLENLAQDGVRVLNHEWSDPATFVSLGVIGADEVAQLSGGRLSRAVDVRVNRAVLEHDLVLIAGPVFPHEVVGFSGGNKYLFPGVAGPDIINLSHWLGALITSYEIIGTPGITPVRALIDRAASLVPTPRRCFALVVRSGSKQLHTLSYGTPEAAWADAAAVSAQVHVTYLDRAYPRVLSMVPAMYQDIWTAAKGMYKLEPVVADGGELVLYAPHVKEFSETHGDLLAEIGYHTRDYFTGQWDRFGDYPGGILAHSTHLRGGGSWDAATGEHPRIKVTLATGISAEACARHNVGYLDPAAIDPAAWARDPDTLVVPKAGEVLHRLRP
jgi:nickel-dependent lactate racemase